MESLRTNRQLGAVALVALLGACDYNGDFLFADVVDIPSVIHLEGPDDGFVTPVTVEYPEEIADHVIYAEVGAPASAEPGGATFTFVGTGRDVCVWVDPELAFWNQKVGLNSQNKAYSYPDNIFDDGDIDLFVGLSVYYTGSPGEAMGDFIVSYEDSLGNEVPIELVSCQTAGLRGPEGHAGRATAEYCTVRNTSLGISYTAALHTFSAPLDDDRLGFGVFLYDGTCESLKTLAGAASLAGEECVIRGEAILPQGTDYGPWVGFDEDRTWTNSTSFEDAFCGEDQDKYCKDEAAAVIDAGSVCSWNDAGVDGGSRCFCGDPEMTPESGAG